MEGDVSDVVDLRGLEEDAELHGEAPPLDQDAQDRGVRESRVGSGGARGRAGHGVPSAGPLS